MFTETNKSLHNNRTSNNYKPDANICHILAIYLFSLIFYCVSFIKTL